MPFAQLIAGPPGSGKTTYCRAARSHLSQRLGRPVAMVNLDPSAEDTAGGTPAWDLDVRTLVRADEVMQRLQLGPNGALMFCIELLVEKNLDWLSRGLMALEQPYVLFDCPGQVELYTHHQSMRKLVDYLQRQLHYRLCTVHLVDSYMCSDPGSFVSALLVSLSAMMRLETPHINVLSKIDLAEAYGRLAFNLDFYTEVLDLSYLTQRLADDPFTARYKALNQALAEVVEDFSLVQFHPLNVQDQDMMDALTRVIDKACGYLYTSQAEGQVALENAAFPAVPFHEAPAILAYDRYLSDLHDEEEEEGPGGKE